MKKACFLCAVLILALFGGGFSSVFAQGERYTNSIGMDFALIPAGSFMMGCNPETGENCYNSEIPQHEVIITQPFYMGKYEVTQAQWQAVMGENPSEFKGRTRPVENVSWDDIQVFIRKLNQKEGRGKYRLPTEAEWEYAARAGSSTAYFFGDDAVQLKDYAWFENNSKRETNPVGQLEPNKWGLYDMHGNVWEWVQDYYADWYYGASQPRDPKGPDFGKYRILRGGSWSINAKLCRSALRNSSSPDNRHGYCGFRMAFSPGQ